MSKKRRISHDQDDIDRKDTSDGDYKKSAVKESRELFEGTYSDEDDDGPARDNTLPDFLLNALVNNLERVNNENCPFEEYIDLEESAWGISNEARHLIIHKNYHDLINFVSNKFASWKPGTLVHSTITGTAGIGKSMFALYLARTVLPEEGDSIVSSYTMETGFGRSQKETANLQGLFSRTRRQRTVSRSSTQQEAAQKSRNYSIDCWYCPTL